MSKSLRQYYFFPLLKKKETSEHYKLRKKALHLIITYLYKFYELADCFSNVTVSMTLKNDPTSCEIPVKIWDVGNVLGMLRMTNK